MKRLLFLVLLLVSGVRFSAMAAATRLDLTTALANHMIAVTATTTGRPYYNKGLKLVVTNKSGSELLLKVDAGLSFQSTDAAVQNLIAAGEETFPLAAWKENSLEIQTFCADATKKVPAAGASYTMGTKGDAKLVEVLQYLKKTYQFDNLGQTAVWTVTDNRNLNMVYDATKDLNAKKLITFLMPVTGKPEPEVYLQYALNVTPGQPVLPANPVKVIAQPEMVLDGMKKLTLGVYNGKGEMVQKVFQDTNYGAGTRKFRVEFQTANAATGKYFIRLKEGDLVLQERGFEIK